MTGTFSRHAWIQPAWSATGPETSVSAGASGAINRAWAFGDATGAGTRVCVIDSGVDTGHPAVGRVERSLTIVAGSDGRAAVGRDSEGDVVGHGTGCAGIIRRMAPATAITSLRVLGPTCTGAISALLAALEWAVDEQFDVINLSLSSRKEVWRDDLHQLIDRATFNGTAVVAAANNWAVTSWPWAFSSVISVGSHARTADGERLQANPHPPARFFAPGISVALARRIHPGGHRQQLRQPARGRTRRPHPRSPSRDGCHRVDPCPHLHRRQHHPPPATPDITELTT
jgi:subtilisin